MYSCSENSVEYDNFTLETEKTSSIESIAGYKPQIEIMLMFLWPEVIADKDRTKVTQIISMSRKLFEDKSIYLQTKAELSKKYNHASCDCVLYYECDGDYEGTNDEVLLCEDIEKRIFENSEKVITFYQSYQMIKELLLSINADFYNVGVEKTDMNIGYISTQKEQLLHINKVSLEAQNQENLLISLYYKHSAFDFVSVQFNLFDKSYSGDLDLIQTPYNVTVQGEIKDQSGRMGMLYWERLK
jgi:hypothetical protein